MWHKLKYINHVQYKQRTMEQSTDIEKIQQITEAIHASAAQEREEKAHLLKVEHTFRMIEMKAQHKHDIDLAQAQSKASTEALLTLLEPLITALQQKEYAQYPQEMSMRKARQNERNENEKT